VADAIERPIPIRRISVFHVTTADLAPLGSQHLAHREREGKLQMQLVETPHDREVGVRHSRGR